MAFAADMPRLEQNGARAVFRTSRVFQCMVLVILLAGPALSTAFLVTEGWREEPLRAVIFGEVIFLFITGVGVVGTRHFHDTIEVDAAGITYSGPRGRRRSFQWGEIAKVRVRPMFSSVIVSHAGGRIGRMRIDHEMFGTSRALLDVLVLAWWQAHKESFANLTLPRNFQASRARIAIALGVPSLFFGGLALASACTGQWLIACVFLAMATPLVVWCARDTALEVIVGTNGIESRYVIGRPRFLPMSVIQAVELGYKALPRVVLSNGKRRPLWTPFGQDPIEVYATTFQAWSDWQKRQASQGERSPAPESGAV